MSTTLSTNILFFSQNNEQHQLAIAEKYPWCSVAQLSLLSHYKKNNSLLFDKQANKTALFFSNMGWLHSQVDLISKQENIITPEEDFSNIEENPLEINKSFSETASQENNEETIAFQPFHTVDYFASQGIKINETPAKNDKLGNQMKSFTEWLKSMKKIHKENMPPDEQTDKNIQKIAEQSNANADVITEAMANIFIVQNKTQKAIEIYEKLSLINPSKSAYFATQINILKTP